MATYEEIHGKRVEVLDSDPTLNSSYEGQVWYNSATGTLKSVVSFASWVSATNMTQARTSIMGNVGTQTASLIGGGEIPGSPGTNLTEEYNGSGWSSGGNRATNFFRVANFGTQTAAVGFSGYNPSSIPTAPARYSISTEEYDGSSWTAGGSFPNGVQTAGCTGTLTAGLQASGIFGPYTTAPSSGWATTCNEYDGSSWTNGTAMPMGRDISTDTGTLTAALMTCGREGPPGTNIKSTFHYDGSAWTASTDTPQAVHGGGGFGTQTSTIVCGGADPSPGRSNQSVLWDGTSWATSGSLGTAKVYGISAGTTTAGMTCAGSTPGAPAGQTGTEEYQSSVNTLTAAAWASSNAMNTGRSILGRAGTQTAALAIGGYFYPGSPEDTTKVEEYNGSTWSEGPDLNESRYGMQCDGSSTAALAAGGISPGSPEFLGNSEEWDNSSWTATPALNTARGYIGHAGGPAASTASVVFGGRVPGPAGSNASESWNGSSWTATPNLNTTAFGRYGGGTSTAALCVGGTPPNTGATEEFNGSSWTSVNSALTARAFRGQAGTQTASIVFGSDSPAITTTEGYDGTNWSTRPALGTARNQAAGTGTDTAALCFGQSPNSGITEEFSSGTETITASTLTTS